METAIIVLVVIIAIAFIMFLVRRNAKDKQDINPELTNELENEEKRGDDIK